MSDRPRASTVAAMGCGLLGVLLLGLLLALLVAVDASETLIDGVLALGAYLIGLFVGTHRP